MREENLLNKKTNIVIPAKAGIHPATIGLPHNGSPPAWGRQWIFGIILLFLFAFPAVAQDAHPPQGAAVAGMHSVDVTPDETAGFAGYAPMDLTTLFNLYFKAGFVKLDNADAVTEYIQTTSCDVFFEKFKDDFAWPQVMKATTAYLGTYTKSFPNRISVFGPIQIDRYNPDQKAFQIAESAQYKNVDAISIADYIHMPAPCSKSGVGLPATIPLRAVIKLNAPFSLTQIPMAEDFARQYLDQMDAGKETSFIKGQEHARMAYIRFYYTINGMEKVGSTREDAEKLMTRGAEFIGTLDGYEIFADPRAQIPMYQWRRKK